MTSAFVYLIVCSFRNRVRTRLKRLRQPRYLAGLVVGVLYLYMVFLRPGARGPGGGGPPDQFLQMALGPLEAGLSVLLFVVVALAWLVPTKRGAIDFTRSEVQFLFPAPVTRRQLIHYKLVRGQVGTLVSSIIFAVILRPGNLLTGLTVMVGLWLTFGLLSLHLTGVSLSRASLVEHGSSGRRRFGLPALIVGGAVVTLLGVVASEWGTLASLASGRELLRELVRLTTTGVAGIVLWPFRAVAGLATASSVDAFLRAIGPAAGLFVVNYLWVVRSDTAFEEASAESAEKRAHDPLRLQPTVKKRLATPFRLAAEGRVETAILWKNLILVGRYVSVKTFVRLLPIVAIFAVVASQNSRTAFTEMAGILLIMLVSMTVLFGPMMARNDLRQDLTNLALIKTWPVPGSALLRGEVLAPAVLLSSLVVVLIGGGALLLAPRMAQSGVSGFDLAAYVATALVLAPMLILGQVVLQNAITVLLPAWAGIGASRARGIDAMGQRILLTFGTLLGLIVGLIPAAIVGGGAGLVFYVISGRVLILIPAVVAAGVILLECWVATELLGAVLDRTDVSAIDAEERV